MRDQILLLYDVMAVPRMRQGEPELQASLGYIMSSSFPPQPPQISKKQESSIGVLILHPTQVSSLSHQAFRKDGPARCFSLTICKNLSSQVLPSVNPGYALDQTAP